MFPRLNGRNSKTIFRILKITQHFAGHATRRGNSLALPPATTSVVVAATCATSREIFLLSPSISFPRHGTRGLECRKVDGTPVLFSRFYLLLRARHVESINSSEEKRARTPYRPAARRYGSRATRYQSAQIARKSRYVSATRAGSLCANK